MLTLLMPSTVCWAVTPPSALPEEFVSTWDFASCQPQERAGIPFLGPWGLISSSSGEWELHQGALQAATSMACSFVGEDQSRWSFDDPTIKLVPASLPALLSWIACMGIPRCPSSHSPQSGAGSLWWWRLRTVPGCRAAVGQWGCSIKWVMLGLWPTGGYIHLAPVQALGLRAW